MSCYESEKGGWSFPSKGWAAVRQLFIDKEHETQMKLYEIRLKVWELSKKEKGGKAYDWKVKDKVLDAAYEAVFGRRWDSWSRKYVSDRPDWADSCAVDIKHGKNGKPMKPVKPKKRKKEDKMYFHSDDGCLSLTFKTRYIDWDVGENNHSVDRAWGHPIGSALASLLQKTDFGTRSGGYTIYRCEYQEDFEPDYRNVKGSKYRKECYGRA